MGGVCSTYEGQVHTGFLWENLRERAHSEDTGADGKIIIKLVFRMWDGEI